MVQSMTGYGKAFVQFLNKKITIEIRSLNSKQQDLNMKIPPCYKAKEMIIRKQLGKRLQRGKIEMSLSQEVMNWREKQMINKEIVRSYMNELKQMISTENELGLLAIAMRMPEVIAAEEEPAGEEEWAAIQKAIDRAIENIIDFRITEGKSLEEDFRLHIHAIYCLLESIDPLEKERIENLKTRLKERCNDEIKSCKIDENRWEQELFFYLEKLDISEEKVRLKTHLDYFLEELSYEESCGKKLGFITQEIGREINTLGSKANHAALQRIVVQMKDELEKIKEQILNTL